MTHKKRKNVNTFSFLAVFLRTEGFSCSLDNRDILNGGIGMSKLQFLTRWTHRTYCTSCSRIMNAKPYNVPI
jgi:hypothetical protein